MTAAEKKERAKKLYEQHLANGAFWNDLERKRFRRRVRRLATICDPGTLVPDEMIAVMCLDSIAIREGIDLVFRSVK